MEKLELAVLEVLLVLWRQVRDEVSGQARVAFFLFRYGCFVTLGKSTCYREFAVCGFIAEFNNRNPLVFGHPMFFLA